MKNLSTRLGLGFSVVALAACMASVALADAPKDGARPQCSGEHGKKTPEERAKHAAERFQKADTNKDGFLTQAEVGDKKWSRIQVADANKDGKVSQAELQQAHTDGKLGHHGKRPA